MAASAHISMITSLYRTEQHLPTFIRHAREVAEQLRQAGYRSEYIIVANDATDHERFLLDEFAAHNPAVRILHVPRESLYASWNRGVQAATGQAVGFWNVDDLRTPEGFITGYQRITGGCPLVYFAHTVIRTGANGQEESRRMYPAVPYDAELHRRVMKCGPFFMFAPELYVRVGGFDERFRIVGDWEWCVRATRLVDFCPANLIAGYFLLHGGNLSDSGNPLQLAEENVVHLLNRAYDRLIPVKPELMQSTWAKWAAGGVSPLPVEIESRLWGDNAIQWRIEWERQEKRKQRRIRLQNMIRYLPKRLIDRTGMRPMLARLGIVKQRIALSDERIQK